MKQGSQRQYSERTQRDGMGREVGGEFTMKGHVHLWLIHVDVWQNHHNVVIIRQLK